MTEDSIPWRWGGEFDGQTVTRIHRMWEEELREILLEPVSEFLSQLADGTDHARTQLYADGLNDLSQLVDEIRFQIGVGALLLIDFKSKLDRGLASENKPGGEAEKKGIPVEVTALLTGFSSLLQTPETLFTNTYVHMTRFRVLGTWFASLLLDSAIVRCVSAIDRLAILLTAAKGTVPSDSKWLPAFRPESLKTMDTIFASHEQWGPLCAYATDERFLLCKEWRDRHVHRSRFPSSMQGALRPYYRAVGANAAKLVAEITPRQHLALCLMMYDAVVRPTVELTGQVLIKR